MNNRFISQVSPTNIKPDSDAYWFIFQGSKLLVFIDEKTVSLPFAKNIEALGKTAVSDNLLRQQYLGYIERETPIHCYAVELSDTASAPAGMTFQGLRKLYGRLDENLFWISARAVQIIDWDRTHQFCSRCATPTQTQPHERSKKCPNCGLITYPRLAPAIIVQVTRVHKGEPHILLARGHRFPPNWYSVIAGFVEPGETLEECVHREIMEEVGVNVKDVRYFGSQPWPFPHSLMVAYTAVYDSGDIIIEEAEIADARWFNKDNLPNIPPPISIARRLIDNFIKS